jgi:hypothetical protein
MAIDSNKEIDELFSQYNQKTGGGEELVTGQGVQPATHSSEGSFLDKFQNILNYEFVGVPIWFWGVLFIIAMIASYFVWKKVTKLRTHNDAKLFKKANNYILKAGDTSRTTMPFALLATLMFLLFIEASGFSYVFSELMINDASEAMLQKVMIFGGFVVSIVLMFLTHFSGEEIHKMSVLKAIDDEMASVEKDKVLAEKEKYPRNRVNLDNTELDDGANTVIIPQYNRINQKYFDWRGFKTNRSYIITIATFILIASIGIGAMFVRFYVFDENSDKFQNPKISAESSYNVKTDFMKIEASGKVDKEESTGLPSYFQEQSKLRDKYRKSSSIEAERKASYITYAIMMMLFFGIQAVGLISGTRYSFVGLESKKAYKIAKAYRE